MKAMSTPNVSRMGLTEVVHLIDQLSRVKEMNAEQREFWRVLRTREEELKGMARVA